MAEWTDRKCSASHDTHSQRFWHFYFYTNQPTPASWPFWRSNAFEIAKYTLSCLVLLPWSHCRSLSLQKVLDIMHNLNFDLTLFSNHIKPWKECAKLLKLSSTKNWNNCSIQSINRVNHSQNARPVVRHRSWNCLILNRISICQPRTGSMRSYINLSKTWFLLNSKLYLFLALIPPLKATVLYGCLTLMHWHHCLLSRNNDHPILTASWLCSF